MRRIMIASILIFSTVFLSGCWNNNKEDNKVTETRMDDIDSIEGTISDDMINSDELNEEPPIEAAAPVDSKAPGSIPGITDKEDRKPSPPETDDKAAAE
ncbi:MAG: hypothetical protein WBO17_07195 [Sphingorhabdus sp.]